LSSSPSSSLILGSTTDPSTSTPSYSLAIASASSSIHLYSLELSWRDAAEASRYADPMSRADRRSSRRGPSGPCLQANLSLLYKVAAGFVPDFILALPTEIPPLPASDFLEDISGIAPGTIVRWQGTPDILVASSTGCMG
jgi:hypothetical protein